MTRRWRHTAVSGVSTLILAACSAGGIGGSAASISPSLGVEPSPSVGPLVYAGPSPMPPAEAFVATGDGPIALAATSESIWVELHRADHVARIDPGTNQLVEDLDVPAHCALASSGDSVWATIAKLDQVTRFAASTGEAQESFTVSDACGVAVDGDTAWVTGDQSVYLLQEGAAEPIRIIPVTLMIFDIVLDETSAWVTSEFYGGTLWRIDRATYEVTRVGDFAEVGPDSVEVAFGSLWLNSRPQGHLWKVDPADGSVLGQVDLREPSGVVAAGDSLWVTLYGGGLVELDPATLEVRSEVQLQYGSLGPPLYAFGSLWVAALENNVVLRIRVDD